MNGPSVYNADANDRYPCDNDILADAPENPVRFLSKADWVWQGMVDCIEDPDRLEAYRQAEKRHIERASSKAKVDVHKYLDDRERELRGEPIEPTPETTPDSRPVPATDGGTQISDVPTDETADTPESDDLHPDVRGLEVGEVLKLERDAKTEYVFPAVPDAEEPFLCRSFNEEDDELTSEPIPLTLGEVASRPIDGTDPKPVSEVDVRAPELAASNGGAE